MDYITQSGIELYNSLRYNAKLKPSVITFVVTNLYNETRSYLASESQQPDKLHLPITQKRVC